MRGLFNDCLRALIGFGIRWLGLALSAAQLIRISAFSRNQRRLRRRYRITPDTPVLPFGREIEGLIKNAAERAGPGARFASTSGSTGRPNRILYTRGRLRAVRLAFVDAFARCCRSLRVRRTSLYVFGPLGGDDSLTSMLLGERGLPPYLSTLQAPYRVQSHPAVRSLVAEYGATAVRLWVLTLSNPGVLYSTNPSTLSTFLDEVASDWRRSSALVRRFRRAPEAFDAGVRVIARRIESRGSAPRLARVAASDLPLPLRACAPAVAAYVCWAGGYVKPFLDRLAAHLPPGQYRLVPMYSMSTETVETVSHFGGGRVSFLPLARGVLYEFVEEGERDAPANLLAAGRLRAGKTYSLVVSDPFGLRRYQTGDLFLCRGFVRGLPDLAFVRRRGLEYSFTGEKLTAEQTAAVFRRLRAEHPSLGGDQFLTCVPSLPRGDHVPHYKLVLVGGACSFPGVLGEELAARCDELLCEMNCEYGAKRSSGRIGRVRFVQTSPGEFARRMRGPAQADGWEAQFKFLPLYRSTWESGDAPPALPHVAAFDARTSGALTPPREAASGANRSHGSPGRG